MTQLLFLSLASGFCGGVVGVCCMVVLMGRRNAESAQEIHERSLDELRRRNQISQQTYERIDSMANDLEDISLSLRRVSP